MRLSDKLDKALDELNYRCDDNGIQAEAIAQAKEQILQAAMESFDGVTRFEVISENGRELVKYDVNIELSLQDDGRTLKVFLRDIKDRWEKKL